MTPRAQGNTWSVQVPAPCDGAALSLHAPSEVLPLHEHGDAYACVVLEGHFVESAGPRECHRRAGDIVLHPAGERHADRFGPHGGRCLNLDLPAESVERLTVRRADAALRAAAETLSVQAALGDAADRLEAECTLAEVHTLLLEPATEHGGGRAVDRVIEALDDEPRRAWTLVELAEVADRHPTHLARAFREKTGVTIGEYRRRRKLAALALALRCTHEPLGWLAHAHGYADQAHMTREFRRAAGCTPGAWRRRFQR